MSTNPENRNINILSDRKAALLALTSKEVKSKLVWDCIKLIKEISTVNVVNQDVQTYLVMKQYTLAKEGASLTYT